MQIPIPFWPGTGSPVLLTDYPSPGSYLQQLPGDGSGGTEQVFTLTAIIHMHLVLQQHELLALVKCYFEDCDADMGIMLAHLQEAQDNAVQAGALQDWY